jgi:excisionase family DNA binding protein
MKEQMELLTRKEAAKLLRVSVRSLDRLRRKGRVRGVLIGHRRAYPRAELERFVSMLRLEEAESRGGSNGNHI